MAPPFTVPCEGREAWFLQRSYGELNPRPPCGSPLLNHCATPTPQMFKIPNNHIEVSNSCIDRYRKTSHAMCPETTADGMQD